MNRTTPNPTTIATWIAGSLLTVTAACTNISTQRTPSALSTASPTPGDNEQTTTTDRHKISNVLITQPTTSSATDGTVVIYFNTSTTYAAITTSCPSTSSCQCTFSWTETNTNNGTNVSVSRSTKSKVTAIQANALQCELPKIYTTEVDDGTTVKITVAASSSNSTEFSINAYNYTKGTSTETGSFRDYQGRSFQNVLRYSCYTQRVRGMSIQSKMGEIGGNANASSETRKYPIANKFCVRKASDSSTQQGCADLPPADYSAQSYYFNMYIRESEVGDINPGNQTFLCPTVNEALNSYSTGSGTTTPVSGQGKYWPLDSSFALSLSRTSDFNIGVVAHTKTSNPSDPASANTACDGTTTESKANTLVNSCLGFAAKPSSDGTCPSFKDSNGNTRLTYRLRRYIALYPAVFDTDGSALNETQLADTIYVVDRPVSGSSDSTKPYTMLGPKPCPFAYYAKSGVIADNALPVYAATNDSRWTGRNVDGIQLPNTDSATSCSAVLPVPNDDLTKISFVTISNKRSSTDPYRQKFIRPITAWNPHYEEDTDFRACAPLADPFRDPPLHFAKDASSNTAYCAEVYPTQNDNVALIDPHSTPSDLNSALTGKVAPYTSHVSKNSLSPSCSASSVSLPSTYPSASGAIPAYARHLSSNVVDTDMNGVSIGSNLTCDRTVINPTTGIQWPRFPLLAPPSAVETALQADSSYRCAVSYDNNGSKSSAEASPSGGCCGSNVLMGTHGSATSAHLEPNTACLTPAY